MSSCAAVSRAIRSLLDLNHALSNGGLWLIVALLVVYAQYIRLLYCIQEVYTITFSMMETCYIGSPLIAQAPELNIPSISIN